MDESQMCYVKWKKPASKGYDSAIPFTWHLGQSTTTGQKKVRGYKAKAGEHSRVMEMFFIFYNHNAFVKTQRRTEHLKRWISLYISYASINLTFKYNSIQFAFSFSFSPKCTVFARNCRTNDVITLQLRGNDVITLQLRECKLIYSNALNFSPFQYSK